MRTVKTLMMLFVVGIVSTVSMAQITLIADINNPDPNEEVTVYVHSDTPLFAMGLGVYVLGDANITSAMCEADCNQYGWDNGWNSDPYIDPNGYVYIGGVRWAGDANGTVGYFKFRYNSWQVQVYLDSTNSCAFGWDNNDVTISTDILSFGQLDPNASNEPNEPNITPPQNHWMQDFFGREPNLFQCPNDVNIISGKSEWPEQCLFEIDSESSNEMLLDAEPEIIEVYSDITTNQIWTANNIYYIGNPIQIQALLVVEPGTEIRLDNGCGLYVNNGGTLISAGTPDYPITYTSVYYEPSFGDYQCAIYVEPNASPATKITYNIIEYAVTGIITEDIRLDTPIQNNRLFYNVWGIYEYGTHHTDILNNLIYSSYYSGIEVGMASYEGIADANSQILVQNNTCDSYQDDGIYIHGVEDGNDAGLVMLANNIVSGSYVYGLHLCDAGEVVYAIVSNMGYYSNSYDKNWEFNEYAPTQATNDPFDESGFHLVNSCPFINAGLQYVEQTLLIGTTTDINGIPDSNKIDIGFHYPNWHYGENYLVWYWDFDESGEIGFGDLAVIANYWLEYFNFQDFANFANQWRQTEQQLTSTAQVSFSQDANNLSGLVDLNISVLDPNKYVLFVLMDGEKYNEVDIENPSTKIQTNRYRNGYHSFKIVRMNSNGSFICSEPVDVNFNNELVIFADSGFVTGKDYRLYGIGNGAYNVTVEDLVNENTIYTSDFDANIVVVIPATAFTEQYGIYNVAISGIEEYQQNIRNEMAMEIQSEAMLDSSGYTYEYVIGKKFRKEDYPQNCASKMVVSIGSDELETDKAKCWQAALKAGIYKQFQPILLRYNECTWDNLEYCLKLNNVKIWYHCSHGAYDLCLEPQRQCIKTKDGWVFSYLKKDFNPVPPYYQELSRYYENNHSIAELGFWSSHKLNWVQFNACFSGRTIEFPYYLGMYQGSWPGNPIGNNIFIGWRNAAFASDILAKYNTFEESYWNKLKVGTVLKFSVEDSLPAGGTNILDNFIYYGVIDYQYVYFRYPYIN